LATICRPQDEPRDDVESTDAWLALTTSAPCILDHNKMASILRAVLNFPIPQFATVGGALQYGRSLGRSLSQPEMVPWAFVGIVGGGWFIWPAIDEDWKNQFGLGEKPEEEIIIVVNETPAKPAFDAETQFKIEQAHLKDAAEVETEADKIIIAEIKGGNFKLLEKGWESDNKS
jgi:hypothetical protein